MTKSQKRASRAKRGSRPGIGGSQKWSKIEILQNLLYKI